MDKDRTNCSDPLDNARRIEVKEISEMAAVQIQGILLDEYPGELFYSAVDMGLILSELFGDGVSSKKVKEELKKLIDGISIRIFELRENVK